MSAAAAPAQVVPPPQVVTQRDDGPLARWLGRLGRTVPVSPAVLVALGALPLAVLVVVRGEHATDAGAGLAVAWLVLVGGLGAGRPHADKLRWAAPPLLRAAEYTALLWLGALAGDGLPGAFAVLCVLWFRHYDVVYRMRHQGRTPPAWLGAVTGGWEGRLVLGWVLLVTGALPAGFYLYAALLALVLVSESIDSWTRHGREQRPVTYDEEEDEGQ
jgi:hypothetical protein